VSEHEQPGRDGSGYENDPQVAPSTEPGATSSAVPDAPWSHERSQPGQSQAAAPLDGAAQPGEPYSGSGPAGAVPTDPAATDPAATDWTATDPAATGPIHPAAPQTGPLPTGPLPTGASPTGWPGYGSPAWTESPYQAPGYPSGYPQAAPHTAWTPGGATQLPPPGPGRRSGRVKLGVAGLVAGALIGGGAGAGVVGLLDRPTSSTTTGSPTAQSVVIKDPTNATSATAAAAKAAPSVVTIYVTNGQGAGSGSGVVLSSDGYVLTNNHVVTLEGSGTGTVQVRTADGTLYDADVVGTDTSADLAVVKLKGASGLKPATFANSDDVQVGDLAVAIGAPLGLSNTVTDGIISATNRAVETGSSANDATVIDAIQTDAAINPGNSGGALVDAAGRVVGINTAIASVASDSLGSQDAQSGNIGVGFAIPGNTAKRIAEEIVKTGKSTHAVLGVSARTATDGDNQEAGTGAQIVQVQGGGPADDAGLKSGDVITAVGDRVVTSSTELTAAIRSSTPGSKVTLTVRNGNSTRKVDVTLSSTTS
jgi:putative serine protease PepD